MRRDQPRPHPRSRCPPQRLNRAEGYTGLRFTNADVLGNTEGVVATIRAEIDRLQSERT